MNWEECPVLVTGGASFISSHLVDELVLRGAKVTVVDDLSNGKKDNLEKSLDKIKFIQQNRIFRFFVLNNVRSIRIY